MKNNTPQPLNQNIIVSRLKRSDGDEKIGGIIIPHDSSPAVPTEEVVIVAVSPDLHLPGGNKPSVKPGDRVLIHRHLNSTPLPVVAGREYLVIGYVNLIVKL